MKNFVCSVVLFVLFIFSNVFAQTKIPLPVWLNSHGEWKKYQLDPYPTWVAEGLQADNNNCGPASVAMAFYYFLGIDLSTTYGSSPAAAQQNSCYTQARWNYSEANGFSGGFKNSYNLTTGSSRMIPVLELEGLNVVLVTGSQDVTLARIRSEIGQGNLVICHVDAGEYKTGGYYTHWTIALGYDANNIYINDPGYSSLTDYSVDNNSFYDALYNANNQSGNDMVLMVVSNPNPSHVGMYSSGYNTSGTSKAVLNRYVEARTQGHPLGQTNNNGPYGYFVHTQGNATWQDFYGTNTGYDHDHTAIMIDGNDSQVARLLKDGFWDWYMHHEGWLVLGAPLSEEFPDGSYTRQIFQYGYMKWYGGNDVRAYDNSGNQIVVNDISMSNSTSSEYAVENSGNINLATVPAGQNLSIALTQNNHNLQARNTSTDEIEATFTIAGVGGATYDLADYVTNTAPDVRVTSISASNYNPVVGDNVTINFTLTNEGSSSAYMNEVFVRGESDGWQTRFELIANNGNPVSLSPGQSASYSVVAGINHASNHYVSVIWSNGAPDHRITIVDNPDGLIPLVLSVLSQAGDPIVTFLGASPNPTYAGQTWQAQFNLEAGTTPVVNDTIRIYRSEPNWVNAVLMYEWTDVDIAANSDQTFVTQPENAPGIGTYNFTAKIKRGTGEEVILASTTNASNPATIYVEEQNPGNGWAETNSWFPTSNPMKDNPYELLIRIYETTNVSSITLPEVRLTLYDTLDAVIADLDTFYNVYIAPDGYFSHQAWYTFENAGKQGIGLRYTTNGTSWDTLETFESQFNITGPPNPYPIEVLVSDSASGDSLNVPEGAVLHTSYPTKDTFYGTAYYQSGRPDHTEFWVGGYGDLYESFLEWNLLSIDPDSVVEVSLALTVAAVPPNDPVHYIYRLTESWVEADVCEGEHPDHATEGRINMPGTHQTQVGDLERVDITDLYKDWLNGTYSNFGIMLSPENTNNTVTYYYSSNHTDSTLWPRLDVVYYGDSISTPNMVTVYDTNTVVFDVDVADGSVYSFASGWTTARSGANLSMEVNNASEKWGDDKDSFYRMFHVYLLANTASLPDTVDVISARLGFYPESVTLSNNNQYAYLSLVQATPFDPWNLTNGDWPNFRTYDYAQELRLENIQTSQINYFNFVSHGLDNVSLTGLTQMGVRSGFDLENYVLSGPNYSLVAMANNSDPNKRPFLEVTYVSSYEVEAGSDTTSSNPNTTSSSLPSITDHATLTNGLVSYWTFDETSGERVDSHGGNNLSDNNTVTSAAGIISNAADFQAANSEYLSIADATQSGLSITGNMTVSAWVQFDSWDPGSFSFILNKDDGQPNRSYAYGVHKNSSGINHIWMLTSLDGTNNNTCNVYVPCADMLADSMYHVVWIYDAGAGSIEAFIDGVSQGTGTGLKTSMKNSTAEFKIGTNDLNSNFFNGVVDEVGIWNRKLTTSEITDLNNNDAGMQYASANPQPTSISGHPTLTNDLISYWGLDEANGIRADSHGNNNLSDNGSVTQGTGIIANCASFSRSGSEYLSIADATQTGLDLTSDFSFAFWSKLDNKQGQTLIDKIEGTAGYRLEEGGGIGYDKLNLVYKDGNGGRRELDDIDFFTGINTGEWVHVVVSVDVDNPANTVFYKNGQAQVVNMNSGSGIAVAASTADFHLGAIQTPYEFFDGDMDQVLIWARAITAQEAADLYGDGNGLPYEQSGLYKRSGPGGDEETITNAIPKTFALHQNFPNPFNPETTIKFDLPTDSHVKIIVYNLLGQRVAVLVNRFEQAGFRQVKWHGTGQASGIYIIRMTADKYTDIKKTVLIR